jgi:hypothetical protein
MSTLDKKNFVVVPKYTSDTERKISPVDIGTVGAYAARVIADDRFVERFTTDGTKKIRSSKVGHAVYFLSVVGICFYCCVTTAEIYWL